MSRQEGPRDARHVRRRRVPVARSRGASSRHAIVARGRSAGASVARRGVRPQNFFTVRAAAPPCECEIEGETRVAKVNGKDVSAAALRAVSVMDRRGGMTNLGEQIGDKGVLVLLRHLG